MKRILIIDPSRAVRETIAVQLAGKYELVQWDSVPEGSALQDVTLGAAAVISSAGPESWTSELKLLAARGTVGVLILADSRAVADSARNTANLSWLVKPFSGYDLRAALERLFNRPSAVAATPRIASASYLDFPFVDRTAARLARRFASYSLPVLIWGELGCGQDRVARAMLTVANYSAPVLLNGVDVRADYLEEKRSQMTEGNLSLANTRNTLNAYWEVGWQKVEEVEYQIDLTYAYTFNRFASVFAGGELSNSELGNRGIFGATYTLPLLVNASAWVDTEGEFRFELEKELPLTSRLSVFGDVQYDTALEWEWQAGATYMIHKHLSLIASYHSDYGAGAGVLLSF